MPYNSQLLAPFALPNPQRGYSRRGMDYCRAFPLRHAGGVDRWREHRRFEGCAAKARSMFSAGQLSWLVRKRRADAPYSMLLGLRVTPDRKATSAV